MDDFLIDDSELDVMPVSPTCNRCRHLDVDHWLETGEYRCAAFQPIPLEIWNGEHDHKTPYKGDGGIRFEAVKPGNEEI